MENPASVTGAGAGAAAGAAIGNQLDKQEAELRQQMGDNVTIRNTGDRLIVTMPQDILFPTDSANLRPTLVSDLRDVGQSLLAYPNTTAQVIGHTDSDGAAAYNLDLSQRRARSVANVLISEGVPSSRISVIGRGEDQPVASNLTPEGKAQNRRVEIVILPNRRETAGKWVHPLAGYVPGQQPFLKRKVQVYNKSEETGDKRLARQGFKRIYAGYY